MVKIYLTLCLTITVSLSSVMSDVSASTSNERKVFPLENFHALVLNGSFEVEITQGKREEVILEGPANVLDEIKVTQRERKVIVGDKPHHHKAIRKIRVLVFLKDIHLLEINGISKLACKTPIESDYLKLYCNGIRDVEFDLNIGNLTAVFDGIGGTYLYGGAEQANIECAGIGNIYATDFRVGILHFESAGIGKAEIYADKELYVDVAGIGTVRYAGNPEIKSISKDGIGKVKAFR